MRVRMRKGDSSLTSIGDACRELSVDGQRVSEARLDASMDRRGVVRGVGDVNGK